MNTLPHEKEILRNWDKYEIPTISICCATFNHEKFIDNALVGFLTQKTKFPFEILIHDDASTDNTPYIIDKYQKSYPHIVKGIFQKTNKYKLGYKPNYEFNIPRAKGKYLALCEGDDYWTYNKKLELQIEFLEQNHEYALCFHEALVITSKEKYLFNKIIGNKNFTAKDLTQKNFISTASCVYRNIHNQHCKYTKKIPAADWGSHFFYAQQGKIFYMDKCMSVYRKHDSGVWSSLSKDESLYKGIKTMAILDYEYKYIYHNFFKIGILERLKKMDPSILENISDIFEKKSTNIEWKKLLNQLEFIIYHSKKSIYASKINDTQNKNSNDKNFINLNLSQMNIDTYYIRRSILKEINRVILDFKGTLLDVGCGQMPYKEYILKLNPHILEYIGLDFPTGKYADRQHPDLTWDGVTIPLPESHIDCAIATEVLEHCPTPLSVLTEIYRVLLPGGRLLLTTPFIWPTHDVPNDYFRYTPFALKRLLVESGFEDIHIKALGGWNASLAQMIGLWLKRAPLNAETRVKAMQDLTPLYEQLIKTDTVPNAYNPGLMATGFACTARKKHSEIKLKSHQKSATKSKTTRNTKHTALNSKEKKILPNLFIIGAMKSGTSSLHRYLSNHPQIAMSSEKEPHFFERHWHPESPKLWEEKLKWYQGLFTPNQVIGESSTGYTMYPDRPKIPERIHSLCPNAKLIYIVRNPIQRIISQHSHYLKRKYTNFQNLKDFILSPKQNYPIFISMYGLQISQYLKYFDIKNIHIVLNEDLMNNRLKTLKNIFKFLNVDIDYTHSDFLKLYNKSSRPAAVQSVPINLNKMLTAIFYDDIRNFEKISSLDLSKWYDNLDYKTYSNIKPALRLVQKSIENRQVDKAYAFLHEILKKDISEKFSTDNKGNLRRSGKTIIITKNFPKLSETFILSQITGLLDHGHDIEIWAQKKPQEGLVHPDISSYDLLKRTKYIKFPNCDINSTEWRENFIKINDIDLNNINLFHIHFGIIFNEIKPLFDNLDHNIIVSFHGSDASEYIKKNGKEYYTYLFQRANMITAPSKLMRKTLIENGCPEAKIHVHRYGVDLDGFFPPESEKNSDEIVFLSVARLVEKKGLEYSLRAFSRLNSTKKKTYLIIGEGPLETKLKTLCRTLNIEKNVLFLGHKDKNDVQNYMRQSHAYVLTSVTASNGDQEGLPVTLIEAHASGLPAISTYHAGIPELVTHQKTGFLCQERDVDCILKYMTIISEHQDIALNMGKNARQTALGKFNIDKLNLNLSNIYKNLLKNE